MRKKKKNEAVRRKVNADLEREREDEVSTQLSEELSDESVIAGVAYMGGVHTRPTHILARQKNEEGEKEFEVKRIFPDREGRTLYFHPADKHNREQKFFPDKEVTEEGRDLDRAVSDAIRAKRIKDMKAGLSSAELGKKEQKYLSEVYNDKKGKSDTKE